MTHQWIKITQQSVDVIVAPDGQPFSSDRPGEPIGEAIGCDACGVPMTAEYASRPCVAVDTALPAA